MGGDTDYSEYFRAAADFGAGTISAPISKIEGHGYHLALDGSTAEGCGTTPFTIYLGITYRFTQRPETAAYGQL